MADANTCTCGSVKIERSKLTGLPRCRGCGALYVDGGWKEPVTNVHPDYEKQVEARRWGGPLNKLYPTLNLEAMAKPNIWAFRVLPHGALVSVRATPSGRIGTPPKIELRIARREAPSSQAGWEKWAVEMSTFLKHFGGPGEWAVGAQVVGKCDTTFVWVSRGHAEPEKCADCGKPAEKGVYTKALCNQCAARHGAEENAGGLLPGIVPPTEDRALAGQPPETSPPRPDPAS